ncbi:MAG: DUF952 domain-containing protein [Bacteriovoracaceae bacterium]
MGPIYHIVEKDIWHKLENDPEYIPASLSSEGFIHFSKADQLLQVANSFYKGKDHLYILKVDSTKLKAELKIEPPLEAPHSGMLFPHLYGPLNRDAIIEMIDWTSGPDGVFTLPKPL